MDVVVIGAVAAGMSAASKAKRTEPEARVRVFGREDNVSYAACGLPYYIGDVVQDQAQLIARTQEEFARQGIEVNVGHEVKKILPKERQLLVLDASGEEQTVNYDKLVICTGARPVLPPIGNSDLANIFTVSSIPDSEAVRAAIEAGAKRAVIVGGGYIGLEMVEALRLKGLEVSVIERSEQIAGTIDPEMAKIVRDYLLAEGVDVQTGVAVEEFIGEETVRGVRTNQGTVPCDLAIIAVGVAPNSELARDAGIELGVRGAIRVNRRMETNLPDIYAAGDCAVAWHELYQDNTYIPLGTTANKQGRIAGENVVGGQAEFAGIVGTGIVKVMELGIGRTGLSNREAETLGKELLSVRVEVNNRAGYYPQAGKGTVKLLFDHEGKVWGAQMVGSDNFAKRIDVLAAAIQSGCSLQQLAGLDLSYSPPFSPVWDPVLVAANVALGKLR
ncbi:MAG: pyridine nucleotide-disulfide oxidoreductase [Firmicutes bacterium]|nr:pyridine nucleotide-disulfide oxidoreductase [Bacillota bacterium]